MKLLFYFEDASNTMFIYLQGSNLKDMTLFDIDISYSNEGADIESGTITSELENAKLSAHFEDSGHLKVEILVNEPINNDDKINLAIIAFNSSEGYDLMNCITLSEVIIEDNSGNEIEAEILENEMVHIIYSNAAPLFRNKLIQQRKNYLIINNNKRMPVEVSIMNMCGRRVINKQCYPPKEKLLIRTTSLSSGCYTCKVKIGNNLFVGKFWICN